MRATRSVKPDVLKLQPVCFQLRAQLCMVCIGRHAGPRQKPTQSACGLARSTLRHTSRHAQPAEERLASIRCKSGQGVSTSDSQPENGGSNEEAEKPIKHAHERNTSWTRMVLALPLELATVTSRTDNFYLRKRKRKHWWSTEHFPKVCWSFFYVYRCDYACAAVLCFTLDSHQHPDM